MINYQHHKMICKLILKEVSGELTSEEERELSAWIDTQPENKALYTQIKNSENFQLRNTKYQQIDILSGWDSLNSKIEKANRVFYFRKIFYYAAAILLPLMVGGGLYMYLTIQEPKVNPIVQVTEILPGKPRAILELDNGKLIELDSLNHMEITEKDGTLIEKGVQGLNYSKNAGNAIEVNMYNTLRIPHGGEYILLLSDSTRVYLNAESQLRYPVHFLGNTREVELNGEAYFEVTKNANKPFVVKTTGMNVEVLGTSFNLNAYVNTEKILTTLVEGSVKIKMQGSQETRLLRPDEQASFDIKSGQTEIKKVDVSLYTSWKDGKLNFYGNRLEDIMVILTRWYSADVVYSGQAVKDLRFSGSLDRYGDINQILDIIKSTGKVNIEIKGNTILFSE